MKITVGRTSIFNLTNCNKSERKISNLTLFLISVVYLFALNFGLRRYSVVWYSIAAICIVYYLFVIVRKNGVIKLDSYCIWFLLFLGYTVLSYFWCISVSRVNMITRSLVLLVMVNILVENLIRTEEDLEMLLFAFYLVLFITAIMIFTSVDFSKLGVERIGIGMEDLNMWNANSVGKLNAVLAVLSLHYLVKKKKMMPNWFYLAGMILGLFLCFNSGSRTGLLYVLLFIVLFFGFREKGKKRFFYFMIGIVLLIGTYVVIMNYQPIYKVLGYRLEQMIRGILLHERQETSYSIRRNMIELGIKWWVSRPMMGYGFGNYSALYYRAVNIDTYSHCNFIEILVNGGIVGFILYYSIYVIIYRLFRNNGSRNTENQKTLFYIIMVELILNVATITYYNWLNHLLIMLSYISLKYGTSEK